MPIRKSNTRAAQGSGTIRQRPDGRWEARYTVGRDPGTGKQVQKSVYADTQAEVRKKLTNATKNIDDGTYTDPSKLTVGQWLDIWLLEYTPDLKENTRISYETQVRQHIKPALGAIRLTELSKHTVQKFCNDLQRKEKPLAAKTVKNIHGVLSKAMSQALGLEYIRSNPCFKAKLPAIEKETIRPLDENSVKAFLDMIKGHTHETLFKVVLLTGLRQAEAMGLTWDAVDYKRGTIHINKQLIKEKKKGGAYKLTSPKHDKSRTITPAPSVMRMLKDHRRQQMEWQLKAGVSWDNDMNLVFTNEIGRHFAHNTLSNSFKRVAVKIGLPDNTFHDLRHTYAVNSLEIGDDPKTLQENLGHHSAAFTLDVYGHVSERMKEASAERKEHYIQTVLRGA